MAEFLCIFHIYSFWHISEASLELRNLINTIYSVVEDPRDPTATELRSEPFEPVLHFQVEIESSLIIIMGFLRSFISLHLE